MKLNSWRGIGSDGDVLLTPYVPEGITGHDNDDELKKSNYALRIKVIKLREHFYQEFLVVNITLVMHVT